MEIIEKLMEDRHGLLHSTELLLSIILLIFIMGTIANLSDDLNERILAEEELSSLESIAVESTDYLLNNPGSPQDWEDDNGIASSNIIPGLAIKKKDVEDGQFYDESTNEEKVIANAISYQKLVKIKNNYNELINENLFNNSYKSSMEVIPFNSKIGPIEMGDGLSGGGSYDNVNDNDIAVVRRTLKCDFYSNFLVYDFNDFELYGEGYTREEDCNHDSNPRLENHGNDMKSYWLCKSFRVYKKSLEDYNYYLISDNPADSNVQWILESIDRPKDRKERLNKEVIDLNPFLLQDLENSTNEIYSIHFNVDKNHINDFKTVLVAIPKNMTDDLKANGELKYDYFKVQEVSFVLKVAYK